MFTKQLKEMSSLTQEIENPNRKPLVGAEFILEVFDTINNDTLYFCFLCDKIISRAEIVPHMSSHRHNINYLSQYFPTIKNIIEKDNRFNRDMTYREKLYDDIIRLIENNFGFCRQKSYKMYEYLFMKEAILKELQSDTHYSEANWAECNELFLTQLHDTLDKVISDEAQNKNDDEDDDYDSSDFYDRRGPSRRRLPCPEVNVYEKFLDKVPRPLTEVELREHLESSRRYNLESSKKRFDRRIEMIHKVKLLKGYAKNPETYPFFEDIWRTFWDVHNDFLLDMDNDNTHYNFERTWKMFWNGKLTESFHLDFNPATYDEKNHMKTFSFKSEISPYIAKSIENEVVRIADTRRRKMAAYIEKKTAKELEAKAKAKILTPETYSTFMENLDYEDPLSNFSENEIVEPRNLLEVCRFLIVLQPELGIFSFPILDLFRKAYSLEILYPNENLPNELYFDAKHKNMFEIVKDKLKGVLTVNRISSKKIHAVKTAIKILNKFLQRMNSEAPKYKLIELENYLNAAIQHLEVKIEIPEPPPAPRISENLEEENKEECCMEMS